MLMNVQEDESLQMVEGEKLVTPSWQPAPTNSCPTAGATEVVEALTIYRATQPELAGSSGDFRYVTTVGPPLRPPILCQSRRHKKAASMEPRFAHKSTRRDCQTCGSRNRRTEISHFKFLPSRNRSVRRDARHSGSCVL